MSADPMCLSFLSFSYTSKLNTVNASGTTLAGRPYSTAGGSLDTLSAAKARAAAAAASATGGGGNGHHQQGSSSRRISATGMATAMVAAGSLALIGQGQQGGEAHCLDGKKASTRREIKDFYDIVIRPIGTGGYGVVSTYIG